MADQILMSSLRVLQFVGALPHSRPIRSEAATLRRGSRELDVDIFFYDEIELRSDDLTVPHSRLAEHRFVLVPFAESAPNSCPSRWGTAMEPAVVYPAGRSKRCERSSYVRARRDRRR